MRISFLLKDLVHATLNIEDQDEDPSNGVAQEEFKPAQKKYQSCAPAFRHWALRNIIQYAWNEATGGKNMSIINRINRTE